MDGAPPSRTKGRSSQPAGSALGKTVAVLLKQGCRIPYRCSRAQPCRTARDLPAAVAGFRSAEVGPAAEALVVVAGPCSLGKVACTFAFEVGSTCLAVPGIADSTWLAVGKTGRS